MIMRYLSVCLAFVLFSANIQAKLIFQEIRTASNTTLVAFFSSDTLNVAEADISDSTQWIINDKPAKQIFRYATQADPCDHHIYLVTDPLEEGKVYSVVTPYGKKELVFNPREIFCESIKTNQVGYSALSKVRYANFAIWLGTGGSQKIEGDIPEYDVFEVKTGKTMQKGTLEEIGADTSSGDYVYRIDLSQVPEGGPYQISVQGIGSSYPFGVGGEFSRKLAYITFRGQYLQRCGCPLQNPDIRENPCHTLIYDADGEIGEANVSVKGDEPTFRCYGGYHDAGDADRRAYHMVNPILDLMIFEAFPQYFYDGQFDIPGDFDENYRILNTINQIPDILDEAEWGTLVWEYLQNDDGSIHFGTETKGYPDPFDAPMDQDTKLYGTVRVDDRATCTGAGLFMHLARLLKPYKPERTVALKARAEKAMAFGSEHMADAERLYYHVQRYLLTGDAEDHQKIKELYPIAGGLKDCLFETNGYSLNDEKFDNLAYIYSYIIETTRPTDPEIVAFFKQAIKDAADGNLAELSKYAYPVGNPSDKGGWGHNVRQPQYACAPLLFWKLSKEQAYFDAASQLMDWKLGLNPLGISYVTGLGFHQVHNPHDRECAYTKKMGLGPKPGITVFGPGIFGWWHVSPVIPSCKELPKERLFVDDMRMISFTEFTIFETMQYEAFYTILSGGGKWNGKNPYKD